MSMIEHELSSGNLFADLGLDDPEKHLVKAELINMVAELIKRRNLSQVEAAELLGIDQPKVSAIFKSRISGFSVERLMRFLTLLGHSVHISVEQNRSNSARVSVEQR